MVRVRGGSSSSKRVTKRGYIDELARLDLLVPMWEYSGMFSVPGG
jgi:hypothetical protein